MYFGEPTLVLSFALPLSALARKRLCKRLRAVLKRDEAIRLYSRFLGTNKQGWNMKKERNPVDEGRDAFNRFAKDLTTRLIVGSLILVFLRIYIERPEFVRAALIAVVSYFR